MMITLLYLALTFKTTPSVDQFCYPPDEHQIQICYWPNRIDCAVSDTPWKLGQICVAAGLTTTDELKQILITDVLEQP